MKRILILGAGFAGLWAAVGAARRLIQAGQQDDVEVRVINARPFHSIRVRNYEADLDVSCVPLADVLDPIGVKWQVGIVRSLDTAAHEVQVETDGELATLGYDRLVFALGSALVHPDIPGLADYAFDVDTHEGAVRLQEHLAALPAQAESPYRYTAIVVGAGLTGLEITAELPDRLAQIAESREGVRVILMDRNFRIAAAMGEAQPVIVEAMRAMGVELRPGVEVKRVTSASIELGGGEVIGASTIIWCGGMHANTLTTGLPVERDKLGRLPVDAYLRVPGIDAVFAAGDSARSLIDGRQPSIMSCQYGRPMGRFAGHNVAADLLGEPLLPLNVDWYSTIVDLGPQGAVYTLGRERRLISRGEAAKRTKQVINRERIYPPRNRDRAAILAAGAPEVDAPPPQF